MKIIKSKLFSMKKVINILLVVIFAFSFINCSNDNNGADNQDSDAIDIKTSNINDNQSSSGTENTTKQQNQNTTQNPEKSEKTEKSENTELKKMEGEGAVFVETEPAHAKIFLDGNFTNMRTPTKLSGVQVGEYVLKVEKQNYKSISKKIIINPESEKNYYFVFEKDSGKLSIDGNIVGADVYLNFYKIGKTPLEIEDLPFGTYFLKAEKLVDGEIYFTSAVFEMNENPKSIDLTFSLWKEPADMVYIPPGEFIFRKDAPTSYDISPFSQKVYIDGFFIDKYEVSNQEFEKEFPDFKRYKYSSEDKQPATGVSWYDALEFAKSQGKRLPTEAEWEKAARGPNYDNYALPGNGLSQRLARISLVDHQGSAEVGSYRPNDYGIYDMTGNAKEWVWDYFTEDKETLKNYQYHNPMGPKEGLERTLKGGGWTDRHSRYHLTRRFHGHPLIGVSGVNGFRCVMDAPNLYYYVWQSKSK